MEATCWVKTRLERLSKISVQQVPRLTLLGDLRAYNLAERSIRTCPMYRLDRSYPTLCSHKPVRTQLGSSCFCNLKWKQFPLPARAHRNRPQSKRLTHR